MVITLTPKAVRKKFGLMFCQGFYTLIDEKYGVAQIMEKCIAKGPIEWNAVNRVRAKGIVRDVYVDGTTLIMNTDIGERKVKFGPVSKNIGGQALKSLKIKGNEVHTTWLGLAGASLGVGACLAQAPGVLKSLYLNIGDLGGSNEAEITIVTAKLNRLLIGLDDTDSKKKGATWALGLKLGNSMPVGTFLQHKIIQLNPKVSEKTTNCVSVGLSFAIKKEDISTAVKFAERFVKANSYSKNTSIAIYQGIVVPEPIRRFGLDAKRYIMTEKEAKTLARKNNITLRPITGTRGTIGALAAIGCFDLGLEAAGLPSDFS